ncbi:MAG: glycoside hydrolase family 28 protein, partial [Muribaculaceae bacterium]|nr:glycoside hydrolase family 28 protein [Muribaculaceae bacterium]
MKKILLSMMLSLSCICMHARDYASRYTGLPVEVAAVTPVKFPSRTVSLTDFGAKGDGMTLCSDAFSRAIESLSAE